LPLQCFPPTAVIADFVHRHCGLDPQSPTTPPQKHSTANPTQENRAKNGNYGLSYFVRICEHNSHFPRGYLAFPSARSTKKIRTVQSFATPQTQRSIGIYAIFAPSK